MFKYILRRLIQAIPTLLGITMLSYGIIILAPGDPVSTLSFGPQTTRAQREALSERLGVDDPVYLQYWKWLVGDAPLEIAGVTLYEGSEYTVTDRRGRIVTDEDGNPVREKGDRGGVLRGDFGKSFSSQKPAINIILEKLPATMELGGLSLIVGFIVGVPIGVLAAVWQGSIFDNVTRVMAVLVSAIPIFWLGLMLLLIFGSQLGWLPMGGRYPADYILTGEVTLAERVKHLLLPVFVLAAGWVAIFSRFMRASTLEILTQDYVRTAQAKGLSNNNVWFVHAGRNALIPIATLLGPAIPNVISGALITETIFSWPGLGRTAFNAVIQLDYPVIMGTVILASLTTIVGYLLSDLLYALIDPRIRLA